MSLPQTGHVKLLGRPNQRSLFRLTVTDRSEYTISGNIEVITGWHGDDSIAESELYLTFYMKWDGCCHVWFGERETNGDQDGYLHLCGSNSWENHIWLMSTLYKWAEKAIPMQVDTSGAFNPTL